MTLTLMIDAPGNQFGILARYRDHKGATRGVAVLPLPRLAAAKIPSCSLRK